MATALQRKRADGANTSGSSLSSQYKQTKSTPTAATTSSSKSVIKDRFKSLALLALILCFIMLGFQMSTSTNTYSTPSDPTLVLEAADIDTASSAHIASSSQIEVILHEDDGDVEVDVPQKLPPVSDSKPIAANDLGSRLLTGQMVRPPVRRQSSNESMPNINQSTLIKNSLTQAQRMQIAKQQQDENRRVHQKYGSLINFRTKHEDKSAPAHLPSIAEMKQNKSRRFYSEDIETPPIMWGWERLCTSTDMPQICNSKRREWVMPAGLYNTGTNVVYHLILQNCAARIRFQPGWGKHEMITAAKVEHADTHIYEGNQRTGLYSESSFLIVVIKDPLTWMKSMCKANYDFRYFNHTWFFESCPQHIKHAAFDWLPMNRGKIMNRGVNKTSNGVYESPLHLWNEWYLSVMNDVDHERYSFLIVRFEDMLFRVESVVSKFCKCTGDCKYKAGVNEKSLRIAEDASKPHGNPRNRTMSFWSYSNPEYRYEGYSDEDLQYMLDVLDPTLLQTFGYEFNVERTKRVRL